MTPRPEYAWQEAALDVYLGGGANTLIVATPGSGKTIFALKATKAEWARGGINQVVVLVPTTNLKTQWEQTFRAGGMKLKEGGRGNDTVGFALPSDVVGYVVTYQQVAANPDLHRRWISEQSTLVILDEPHHMGEPWSWGTAVRQACDPAVRRLLLSGTPFRTDGEPIPYVRYNRANCCMPDFHYTYLQAMRDGVCRAVAFKTFGGELEWLDEGDATIVATFEDRLSEQDAGRRLRTALRTGWMESVLAEADRTLSEQRQSNPDAAGLVVATDIHHARALADMLTRIAGEAVQIAVSEDEEANDRIKAFRDARTRWLVSVKMVSEGADIPRFRVLVFASTTATSLFFRQVVGRVVRRQGILDSEHAYVFLPRDEQLLGLCKEIEQETEQYFVELKRQGSDEEEGDDLRGPRIAPAFVPLSGVAFADETIVSGQALTLADIRSAQTLREANPDITESPERIARILQAAGRTMPLAPLHESRPVIDEDAPLRKKANDLVGQLARRSGRSYKDIHTTLQRMTGAWTEEASTAQLKDRIRIVRVWLDAY